MKAKYLWLQFVVCAVVTGFSFAFVAGQTTEAPNDRDEADAGTNDALPESSPTASSRSGAVSAKYTSRAEDSELERKFVELARQRFQAMIQQDRMKVAEVMQAMEREIQENKAADELDQIMKSLDGLIKKHPGTGAAVTAQRMLQLSRNMHYVPDIKAPVTYYPPEPISPGPSTSVPTLAPAPSGKSVLK